MSDLIAVKGNTYILEGSVHCGFFVNDKKECILIDSGLDDGYSRRILKVLQEKDWTLTAVVNTHSHADHCGGNHLLQKRTEAAFFASSFEAAIIKNPVIEPYYLYSASPPPQLMGKFLRAEPTTEVHTIQPGVVELGGCVVKLVALPGHSAEQLGVVTTDGVFFVGDALFPAQVWEKYKIPYYENIENALSTLEMLKGVSCEEFVIAHYGRVHEIHKMAQHNIQGLKDLIGIVLEAARQPITRETLLARLVNDYDIPMSIVQYHLLSSTISAFLSYLTEKKQIGPMVDKGLLYWQQI